jgi:glycosyltransferase involved in cell wall biosynthesis
MPKKHGMHICFVQMCFYPDPQFTAFFEYSQRASEISGISCSVICAGHLEEPELEKIGAVDVYRIHMASTRKLSYRPLIFVAKARQVLAGIMRKKPVDVVHLFQSWEMILFRLLCRCKGTKFVFDIRSSAIRNVFVYTVGLCLHRLSILIFDWIFVIHPEWKNALFNKSARVSLAPLGVELSRFTIDLEKRNQVRRRYGIKERDLVFVFSGSFNKSKQVPKLVRAILSFLSSGYEGDVYFMLIGDGVDRSNVNKLLSRKKRFSSRIILTGHVPKTCMPEFLAAADVGLSYVPMDRIYDNQPALKTLEYLAMGLAVLATDTKGHRMYIRDGANGLLVKDTEMDLVRGMTILAEDSSLRKSLALGARASVADCSWDRVVGDYLIPVYRTLVCG